MKKKRPLLLNVKFRTRLLISYIIIALIPHTLFAVVGSAVFISRVQKTAISHTAQMVRQVSYSIDIYIQNIDKIANYISHTHTEQFGDETLNETLRGIADSYPEIAGIMIAMENESYTGIGMSRISRDSFKNEEWYASAIAAEGEIVLVNNTLGRNITTNVDYSVDNVFSLAKAIIDSNTGKLLGVILFDVKHDIITEFISSITIGENGFIFVTNAYGDIIYTPLNNVVYRVNPLWLNGNETTLTVTIANSQYQIYCENSIYTGWKTVGVFPLDEVMSNVNSMFWILIVTMTVSLMFIFFIALPLSNSVTHPISKLRKLMKQAESGDLSVHFDARSNDEIGELGKSFNNMVSRIDELIKLVYISQKNKQDAEMKILQEQIKPHFLYNTLDTISWLARDYDAKDIVQLVDALTNMFRVGLNQGRDVIHISEEISHISNYLYIQKIRYKSKMNYTINVNQELYQEMVPKLILQPLVENAIYHGIKQKRGGGSIHINGITANDMLSLTVQDDGAGMTQEKVDYIMSVLTDDNQQQQLTSFGLFYIKERLRIYYKKGYTIEVKSTLGVGTSVTLLLPKGKEF